MGRAATSTDRLADELVAWEFGPFRLDARERTLWRGGAPLVLPGKVFQLLVVLLQSSGRYLTREELAERVWPGVHVAENTLSQGIWLVRNALGRDHGSLIETRVGLGYRLTASVRIIAPERLLPQGAPGFRLVCPESIQPLQRGTYVLGRDPGADVVIDSRSVSRRHACITVGDEGCTLEDLESKSGTFVRGARVKGPTPLQDGDEIGLGTYRFVFRVGGRSGDTSTLTRSSAKGR
jgi:DNA-binding winged helix-turn-helix (wHTH) protein